MEHTITFSIQFNPRRPKPFSPVAFRGTGGLKDLGLAQRRCDVLNIHYQMMGWKTFKSLFEKGIPA